MFDTGYDSEGCQLLGPVSITLQLGMGMIAFSGLIIKRKYEHPKRKVVVWLYDVGKQVFGALIIHCLNLGLSLIKRKRQERLRRRGAAAITDDEDDDDGDQCDWYFLNLLLDTTFGIPILWACLNFMHFIFMYLEIKNIESGNYFPPIDDTDSNEEEPTPYPSNDNNRQPMFSAFLKQLFIYSSSLLLMKFAIFFILNYFESFAYWFANLVLGWSDKWPNFQVFLVMFICPIVLNCFQILCIDSIIKLPTAHLTYSSLESFEPGSFVAGKDDNEDAENQNHNTNFSSVTRLLLDKDIEENQSGNISYGAI